MYLELIFFFLSFARCWSFLHFVFVHSLLSSLFFILRSIEKNNENKCTIFKKNVVMYLQKQRFVSPTAQCVHYTVCIWNKYTHHAQMMHRNIKERRDRKKNEKEKTEKPWRNHEEFSSEFVFLFCLFSERSFKSNECTAYNFCWSFMCNATTQKKIVSSSDACETTTRNDVEK